MSFQYRKNIYVCEANGHRTVTIDRDVGTTPFITSCPVCGRDAQSQFYRIDQNTIPTHEWYAPASNEELMQAMKKHSLPHIRAAIRVHVSRGGLLLREINRGQEERKPKAAEDTKGTPG